MVLSVLCKLYCVTRKMLQYRIAAADCQRKFPWIFQTVFICVLKNKTWASLRCFEVRLGLLSLGVWDSAVLETSSPSPSRVIRLQINSFISWTRLVRLSELQEFLCCVSRLCAAQEAASLFGTEYSYEMCCLRCTWTAARSVDTLLYGGGVTARLFQLLTLTS
jgi:hypothetical protein